MMSKMVGDDSGALHSDKFLCMSNCTVCCVR